MRGIAYRRHPAAREKARALRKLKDAELGG